MTVVKTVIYVELDQQWIDAILKTAFDYAEGSVNYWLVDEDVDRIGDFRGIQPYLNGDKWYGVEVKGSEGNVVVGGAMLSGAVATILNDEDWLGTETEKQLLAALEKPDELPDLDGEACDVIVQVAMYGELVYG